MNDGRDGQRLVQASWIGTGIFTVTAMIGAVDPKVFGLVAVVVALCLFFVGLGVFAWSFAIAVARSRSDEISIAGLYLLSGSAPKRVQLQLLGSLAVEVVTAFATAGARVNSSLAFGVLVPLYGLAVAGLWSARYGSFPPRPPDRRRLGKQ